MQMREVMNSKNSSTKTVKSDQKYIWRYWGGGRLNLAPEIYTIKETE